MIDYFLHIFNWVTSSLKGSVIFHTCLQTSSANIKFCSDGFSVREIWQLQLFGQNPVNSDGWSQEMEILYVDSMLLFRASRFTYSWKKQSQELYFGSFLTLKKKKSYSSTEPSS